MKVIQNVNGRRSNVYVHKYRSMILVEMILLRLSSSHIRRRIKDLRIER